MRQVVCQMSVSRIVCGEISEVCKRSIIDVEAKQNNGGIQSLRANRNWRS